MRPVALGCPACNLTVQGTFTANEFANLDAESLHFLRIFIHTEGKIRDMESALGVSYPTIKARMAKLKETLATAKPEPAPEPAAAPQDDVAAALSELDAGTISYDELLARIRNRRPAAD